MRPAPDQSRRAATAGGRPPPRRRTPRRRYRFEARDLHLVLAGGPVPFRVFLDGEAPGASAGEDIDADGNGTIRDGRLYQLVRQHDRVRERTFEIAFLEPGAEAYVFTFG